MILNINPRAQTSDMFEQIPGTVAWFRHFIRLFCSMTFPESITLFKDQMPIRQWIRNTWFRWTHTWEFCVFSTGGSISRSLLTHSCCHLDLMWVAISGLRSEWGIRQGSISQLRAFFAAPSARSFPPILAWPIQPYSTAGCQIHLLPAGSYCLFVSCFKS